MKKVINSAVDPDKLYQVEVINLKDVYVTVVTRISPSEFDEEIINEWLDVDDLVDCLEIDVQDFIQDYDKKIDIEKYLDKCGFTEELE